MAHNNFEPLLGKEQIKFKRCLYAIRTLLACSYVDHTGEPAPVSFAELVAAELEPDMKPAVYELVERKMRADEKQLEAPDSRIMDYIIRKMANMEQRSAQKQPCDEKPWKPLDGFMCQTVLCEKQKT